MEVSDVAAAIDRAPSAASDDLDTRPAGLIAGRATRDGTRSFAARQDAAGDFYREGPNRLILSSLGLGTGGFDITQPDVTVARFFETIREAVGAGINVIDTAINYGWQTTERIVGHAIRALIDEKAGGRDEIVLVTKGGYLPYDVSRFHTLFVESGQCREEELVGSVHCLNPEFLWNQIHESRRNLGVDVIDVYLLHNPEEQLRHRGLGVFESRVRAAFGALEDAVQAGLIGCYGVSSADGFRSDGTALHRIDDLFACAEASGGRKHHLRVIEAPLNLHDRELAVRRNHVWQGSPATPLDVASGLGVSVITSVPLGGGRLARVAAGPAAEAVTLASLHFVRSTPGVTSCLIGMSRPEHVRENLRLRYLPSDAAWSRRLLQRLR